MSTARMFTASEHQLLQLPEGSYWITNIAVMLGDRRIDSGMHRYWKGVLETNGLTKSLLISRLREKRSVFTADSVVSVHGWYYPNGE